MVRIKLIKEFHGRFGERFKVCCAEEETTLKKVITRVLDLCTVYRHMCVVFEESL